MKTRNFKTNLFAFFLLSVLTLGSAFSQSGKGIMKDCCMMKGGKMMEVKNGEATPMTQDVTLSNGTVCMTNGECVMANGSKMKMREGECMDMTGKIGKCPPLKANKKVTTKTTRVRRTQSSTKH